MLDQFIYTYKNNNAAHTLFLLHGTGGSEDDFLFLDDTLHHTYNLVGLRGNVDENGARRFFKRLAPGIFDEESIKSESGKLHQFIGEWVKEKRVAAEHLVFLGYSNGANILMATVLAYPKDIHAVVLLHPMLPISTVPRDLDLSSLHAFVSYGQEDQMVPTQESMRLVEVLQSAGAKVMSHEYDGGHGIGAQELRDVISFLQVTHKP
jgi:phospholipase/carboxylesterase